MKKLLIIAFVAASCGEARMEHASAAIEKEATEYKQEEIMNNGSSNGNELIAAPSAISLADISIIPDKIIKTADISMEFDSYRDTRPLMKTIVHKWGAYVANENEMFESYQASNTLTIRVANKNFEKLIEDMEKLAVRVDYRRVNSTDVSEEYVDIIARLKTKKEVEKRYMTFLAKAINMDETFKVEGKIRLIREEIEAKEGRLKYLNNRIGLSTITLRVYQNFEQDETPYQAPGFLSKFADSFKNGWGGILAVILTLTNIWPIILVFGGTFWWVKRTFIDK